MMIAVCLGGLTVTTIAMFSDLPPELRLFPLLSVGFIFGIIMFIALIRQHSKKPGKRGERPDINNQEG